MRRKYSFMAVGLIFMTMSCAKPAKNTHAAQGQAPLAQASPTTASSQDKSSAPYRIFQFPPSQYVLGKSDAPLPVVMFVNYFCGNCSRADRALQALLEDPEFSSTINVSYRQLPKTKQGVKAAKIVLAAGFQGQKQYWSMSRKLFDKEGMVTDKDYLTLAHEGNIDAARLAKDLVERETELTEALRHDRAMVHFLNQRGRKSGIFIGGYFFGGDVSTENLRAAIRRVIALKLNQNASGVVNVPKA